MNGFLHRLAARAAGTAISVRSDARLPFGSIEPAFGETVALESSAARAAPSVTATAGAPAGSDTSMAAVGDPDAQPAPSALFPRDARPASASPALPPFDLPAASPTMRTLPRFVDAPVDAAPRHRDEAPAAAMSLLHDSAPASVEPPAGPAPMAAISRPTPTGLSSPGDPPRLMPLAAPRQSPRSVPPAGGLVERLTQVARVPVHATDEGHDVHIHIGRIDVTAVHEPAAPRRRPVAAPVPMSLDAYFARRNRT